MANKLFDMMLIAGIGVGAYLFLTDQLSGIVGYYENEDDAVFEQLELPTSTSSSPGHETWFPIQDLYIPPNYYKNYEWSAPYQKPSEEFEDWYKMGSGLYLEDYWIPPHYWDNPDVYYWFGNMYQRRYPSIADVPGINQ